MLGSAWKINVLGQKRENLRHTLISDRHLSDFFPPVDEDYLCHVVVDSKSCQTRTIILVESMGAYKFVLTSNFGSIFFYGRPPKNLVSDTHNR